MTNRWHAISLKLIILLFTLPVLFIAGCQHVQVWTQGNGSAAQHISKIVVIGFKPASFQGDAADDAQVPISNDRSHADPVLLGKAEHLTSRLFVMMGEHKGYELVNPESARLLSSRVTASEPDMGEFKAAGRIAVELKADAALVGYLYRWRDREGSDYAVNSPASVFFELFLINPEDSSFLWKGRFNKTQKSLNENLLDIRTFLKGKGKWMTADDLGGLGLDDLVKDLFIFIENGKGAEN